MTANPQLVVIVSYAVALVLLGFLVSRYVKTSSDFFVAGRSLSPQLLFSTLLAANIGAGSTVGAAGLGYEYGLSAWWWVGSAGLGQLVLATTVGPRIWRLAKSRGFFTLGDYLEHRYGRPVRGLIAGLLWLGSLCILAGQLIGIAWILNVITGVPKPVGCLMGGLCVTLYFSAGGLLSAAWVNVVQLAVKLAGFCVALPMALAAVGGWGGITRAANELHLEGFTSVTGIGASGVFGYLVLLVPPFIVSPGLLQKIYGARDESAVRKGTAANAFAMLLFAILPVLLGMVARAASLPALTEREMALPSVMTHLLPLWVGALALAAIFSAEVSAADAVLFMLATSFSKDIYKGYIRPAATDERLFRVGRLSAVAGGAAGVVLAVVLPSIISALTLFYALVTVSLFVPVVAGLYSRRPSGRIAWAAITLAVAGTVLAHVTTGGKGFAGASPVTIGLLISAAVFLCSLLERRPRHADAGLL